MSEPNPGAAQTRGPLFLINTLFGSRHCHYGFQVDTFTDGCSHDCVYCFAKEEGERVQKWNNPRPRPVDIDAIRQIFETAFETDQKSPWRQILERRVPLRIGGYSDCFIKSEKKAGVTLALLKLLKAYRYPHVIVTRSSLAATEPYLAAMDPELTVLQLSIPSLNPVLSKALEPGAPAPAQRVETVQRLSDAGFVVGIRCNPLFPNYPDGHYSGSVAAPADVPRFDYFSEEQVDAVADAGAQTFLVGFVHLSSVALAGVQLSLAPLGIDLRHLLTPEQRATGRFAYSSEEMRAYYERIRERCKARGMAFTTCYLGTGDGRYREFDDLWEDKQDCCAIKGCRTAFTTTAEELSQNQRLKANSPELGWLPRTARVVVGGMGDWLATQLAPGSPPDRPGASTDEP